MSKSLTHQPAPSTHKAQRELLRYAALCALGPYLLAATALLLFGAGAGG